MRRDIEPDVALAELGPHPRKGPALQHGEIAMDQPRCRRRCGGTEIALLQQDHAQAAAGGVAVGDDDDPLVEPLEKLGEPIFKLESNPTVERIAKLIFDMSRHQGLEVMAVRIWETPTSFAEYRE